MSEYYADLLDKSKPYFEHEHALKCSAQYAERYVEQHEILMDGLTADMAKILACARLEWLLQAGRSQLKGILTEEDFIIMLNCFQAELFHPEQFHLFVSAICDDQGVEPHEYESSHLKELVDSLFKLNPLTMVALADSLEQLWHRGLDAPGTISEFLETLGIELREEVVHA